MTGHPLRLTGFSSGSHAEVVSGARDALGSIGASIMDFHMFSNAILCLNFEVTAGRLSAFPDRLADAGIRLDAGSAAELCAEEDGTNSTTDNQCACVEGSLSIRIINDEPALRIEVPAVPG